VSLPRLPMPCITRPASGCESCRSASRTCSYRRDPMYKFSLAVSAGLLLALPASAAVPSADQQFAKQAASGGMAEIQAAQLAQQRAGSPQVRQFASRMITDHTDANNELQ